MTSGANRWTTAAGWRRISRLSTVRASRRDRARFLALASVDAATKHRLFPQVRRTINRLYLAQTPTSAAQYLGKMALFTLLFVPACFLLIRWIAASLSMAWKPLSLECAGALLSYASIFLLDRLHARSRAVAIAAFPLTLLVFAALVTYTHQAHAPAFQNAIAFLGGASLVGAFATALLIGQLPLILLSARAIRHSIDARIFVRVLNLLSKIEQHPFRWQELAFKTELLTELNAIARMIQHDLPAQCSSFEDEVFRAWLRERMTLVATRFREMKQWIILPRADTRDYLLQQLAAITISLAQGDWDALPTAQTSQQARRAGHLANALGSLRTLAASVLPILILVALARLHVRLPEALRLYAYLAASFWLGIGVLSLLDPLYAARLDAVKSAMQIFPLGGK
ncbi:MAG TPA: hypothetical protein VGD62_04990 [Acidobacteriaceae bacterium]